MFDEKEIKRRACEALQKWREQERLLELAEDCFLVEAAACELEAARKEYIRLWDMLRKEGKTDERP